MIVLDFPSFQQFLKHELKKDIEDTEKKISEFVKMISEGKFTMPKTSMSMPREIMIQFSNLQVLYDATNVENNPKAMEKFIYDCLKIRVDIQSMEPVEQRVYWQMMDVKKVARSIRQKLKKR